MPLGPRYHGAGRAKGKLELGIRPEHFALTGRRRDGAFRCGGHRASRTSGAYKIVTAAAGTVAPHVAAGASRSAGGRGPGSSIPPEWTKIYVDEHLVEEETT